MEHYFTNNPNLKSELREITYIYKDRRFTFQSDNGIFSKNKIDFGSQTLLETILENVNQVNLNILDVGCGYGLIGIVLAKQLFSHADIIDVNKRAIHLAHNNIVNNKVDANAFLSDGYEAVTNKYDLIVTNPPIRAGKATVYRFLKDASTYLSKDGELWFVINKDQGAKSAIKDLKYLYDLVIVTKNKGFYVVKAKNKLT